MCLQSGGDSSDTSRVIAEGIADAQETITGKEVIVDDDYIMITRKVLGHFGYFMVLGIVSALLYLSLYTLKPFYRISIHYVSGIFFALVSEFVLEASADGRGPSFTDALIDSIGFISVSSIIILIWLFNRMKKHVWLSIKPWDVLEVLFFYSDLITYKKIFTNGKKML